MFPNGSLHKYTDRWPGAPSHVVSAVHSPKREGRADHFGDGGDERRPQLQHRPEQHAPDLEAGANQEQYKQQQ